jgi:CubicO group peptidase (beta-lactamase class C family)
VGTNPEKNLHGFSLGTNEDIGNWVWDKNLMAPAGGISSTAEDLLEYARMNMFEEKPYFELCHQKYVDAKKHDMGLGWVLQKNKNHILWHNGGTGGFRSYLGIDKHKKCAVVVLANYVINTDKIGIGILDSL